MLVENLILPIFVQFMAFLLIYVPFFAPPILTIVHLRIMFYRYYYFYVNFSYREMKIGNVCIVSQLHTEDFQPHFASFTDVK